MMFLQHLNATQKRAVTSESEHILVLAGAGSGKTRVLTSRILWLLEEKKIPAHSILALTFTNKAAQEMRQRVQNMSPTAHDVMLTTFHSFGAWFLRKYANFFQFPRYFSIYDDEESVSLLKRFFPKEPIVHLKAVYHQIQRCKDGSLLLQEQEDLSDVYGQFNAALRANRAVDFGDLIYLPQHFLAHNDLLKQAVQQRWKAILVDEYQDTNITQAQLLQQMTGEHTYVMVVGDDDQSIYRFRGAEPTNMLDFSQKMPDCEIIKLEENYRSTPAILACANELIRYNTGRLGKELYSNTAKGEKPQLIILDDQEAEAAYVCQLLESGSLQDTAVLYRVNAQSRALESALMRNKIPYIILGSIRFYQREEIKTTLAWLSFLLNPYDEASFTRLVGRPTQGIGPKNIQTILEARNQEGSILDAMAHVVDHMKGKAAKSCARLIELFAKWHTDLTQQSLVDFFRNFVHESGLYEHYGQKDRAEHTERLNNIQELMTVLENYGNGVASLAEFLEAASLAQQVEESEYGNKNDARVTLMTVHNAKGLEYKRIILLGMEEELFPWEPLGTDDVEEERRLCYVAVTRAKKELYMLRTHQRSLYGKTTSRRPSRFLTEMGTDNFSILARHAGNNQQAESVQDGLFRKGDWVRHADYGIGKVIASDIISGRQVIQVHFEGGKKGKFLPEFTSLEKLPPPDMS